MREEFRNALALARRYDDPDGRINVIKRAVTGEITAVDPTARARFTDYFNHSVAPDIVLQWPNENRERLLFVRPNGHADRLLPDIAYLAPHQPVVFTLEDLDESPGMIEGKHDAWESLEGAASAAGTWITDSSGTQVMANARTLSPTLGLLSQALTRGGRGVSTGQDITELINLTEYGFAASSHLVTEATRSAVEGIEGHLNEDQSGRLTRLLRAVWEANGGDSAMFPATATLGALTEDDLSYLLETTDEGPADFWRRISGAVNTAMLGRLQVSDPSPNLQALMYECIERLQAKGLRLRHEQLRLNESEVVPRWLVSKGCLALRGSNWTAYIAARVKEELPPPGESESLDLPTLNSRAEKNPVPITQVKLRRGDRILAYESKEGGNVLNHPGLSKAAADLNVADIEEAVTRLPGGGNVEIEFATNTAIGPTSSMFPLGTLIRSALPLLVDFPEEEYTKLRRILAGEGYQPSLFEAENEEMASRGLPDTSDTDNRDEGHLSA
jgi:hypothetical protein